MSNNQNDPTTKHSKESIFLNWFDLFGKSLSIQISGKNKQSTLLGAILGVFSIISIVTLSIYFLIDLFQLNTVNIMYNTNRDLIPMNNISHFPIVFKLADATGRPISTEGLYNIDVIMAHYIPITEGGVAKINYVPIKVNYTKCDYEKSLGEYKSFFKTTPFFNELFCIPPNSNNLTLFGKYSDTANGFSYMNFYVNRCINSTNTRCLSDNEINRKLENAYFALVFIDYQIDHYNTTQAFKQVAKTSALSMSHTLLKRYFYSSDKFFMKLIMD